MLSGLQHLRFQGHEVTLFHVLHPDEIDFPFDGMVKFDGLELPQNVLTRPHMIRPAYRRIVQKYLHDLRRGGRRNAAADSGSVQHHPHLRSGGLV